MPIPKILEVTLTQDRFTKPLAIIESSLGNGLEIYPAQMRTLAAALCKAADDAEARTHNAKYHSVEKRSYTLLASANMTLDLVPVAAAKRTSDEDWYIHFNGLSRGYIYRVDGGYAVGIDIGGKIKHHSIEPNKQAAIALAETH